MGKQFFKYLKAFYILSTTFLSIIYAASIIYNIVHLDVFLLFLINIVFVLIVLIMTFIFNYYKNMTVDINFSGNDIIICTNKEKLIFPKKQVEEIVKMPGKIILKCYVNGKQKHFLYQTIYIPFKENKVIIKCLKDNLPSCKFSTGSNLMWSLYYWR